MGKEIGCSYKYNRSKISSPTLKKPALSSSAAHTSYTTRSTPTIMYHQLQHKDSTSIKNTVNISSTYDIHSCVTPLKQNISVQATSTPLRLTPLITTLPLLPSGGKCVVFGYSPGKRGKVVINGVKQGGVDVA